jgi:hypothetical protein
MRSSQAYEITPIARIRIVLIHRVQMFAFSAVAVGQLREMQNGGKKGRRGLDQWDRVRCFLIIMLGIAANKMPAKYDTSDMTSHLHTDHSIVMERDRRLTGFARGQTDKPFAPAGFELNNPWRVWSPNYCIHGDSTNKMQVEERFF